VPAADAAAGDAADIVSVGASSVPGPRTVFACPRPRDSYLLAGGGVLNYSVYLQPSPMGECRHKGAKSNLTSSLTCDQGTLSSRDSTNPLTGMPDLKEFAALFRIFRCLTPAGRQGIELRLRHLGSTTFNIRAGVVWVLSPIRSQDMAAADRSEKVACGSST
jgi:hypothetical protein